MFDNSWQSDIFERQILAGGDSPTSELVIHRKMGVEGQNLSNQKNGQKYLLAKNVKFSVNC